jgi:hypothetical protein
MGGTYGTTRVLLAKAVEEQRSLAEQLEDYWVTVEAGTRTAARAGSTRRRLSRRGRCRVEELGDGWFVPEEWAAASPAAESSPRRHQDGCLSPLPWEAKKPKECLW